MIFLSSFKIKENQFLLIEKQDKIFKNFFYIIQIVISKAYFLLFQPHKHFKYVRNLNIYTVYGNYKLLPHKSISTTLGVGVTKISEPQFNVPVSLILTFALMDHFSPQTDKRKKGTLYIIRRARTDKSGYTVWTVSLLEREK